MCVWGRGVGTDAQDPMNTAEDKGQLKDFDEDCSFRSTSVFLSFLKIIFLSTSLIFNFSIHIIYFNSNLIILEEFGFN